MSRSSEQAERFRMTPCPAKMSRNKLRRLMPRNLKNLTADALMDPKNTFHIPGRQRRVGHFHRHYIRPTRDTGSVVPLDSRHSRDRIASFQPDAQPITALNTLNWPQQWLSAAQRTQK